MPQQRLGGVNLENAARDEIATFEPAQTRNPAHESLQNQRLPNRGDCKPAAEAEQQESRAKARLSRIRTPITLNLGDDFETSTTSWKRNRDLQRLIRAKKSSRAGCAPGYG
jgi:hypothetical protein